MDKASNGLKARMESFLFKMTAPDGKTIEIGSDQAPPATPPRAKKKSQPPRT